MLKYKTIISIYMLLILFSSLTPCLANSAEPPSILIIVSNAPDDLEISISSKDFLYKSNKVNKKIETYFLFYNSEIQMRNVNDYNLKISTNKENYEIKFDKPIKTYSNVYTLNLKSKTLTEGKNFSRSILLVTLRIILTIVIEAFVFLLFKFKNKKSYISFIIINLITQGALNIWINGFIPSQGYLIFALIIGEFFVVAFEILAFLIFVKEHKKFRTILYVISANALSLIVGGFIITILPI